MNKTQFFKYLADGGKVRMITWHGKPLPKDHKLASIKQAEKVQSNAVMFTDGSWLYKDDIKANDVTEVAVGYIKKAVSLGLCVYQLEE
jgi:hypothetical protein